ncbi:hypothetical protein BG011_009428 [Mortierella polycephala]|uniref:Ubiquitin carboxyl-terminal hydrolase n=1 Tax=Mortierella polycephala TaxID=41804 RepID=A0A9P6QBJ4_9FUNG|nr:hypothetical protein BG011_009428 [Mortierella polycephala]
MTLWDEDKAKAKGELSYDPQQGPAFGQLTREDISKVVKKDDVDVVVWSIGKRPKAGFPSKIRTLPSNSLSSGFVLQQDGAVKPSDGSLAATGDSAPASVVGPGVIDAVAKNVLTTDAAAPATPSASSKPTWAELLRSKNQPSPSTPSTANGTPNLKSVEGSKASNVNGVKFDGIADVLHKFKPTYTSSLIQPRGLVNNGNMCFMNAILQPLLHCPPFYNLLMQIGKHVAHSFKSSTPLVDSLIMFLNEFHVSKKNQPDYGPPFVPEYVYDALRGLKRFDSMKGRQEDCQEFLGYLLDGLHEEFFAAMKEKPAGSEANGHLEHDDSDSGASKDEWMEVTGSKNKASYTRSTQFSETPISIIFSGQLRSILRIPTQKDSVTLEPFQSLQLDLTPDNVYTIEDALRNSTMAEKLDGFTSAEKGGIPVEATKKIFIEHVPPVLVLHLKRFIYKDGGTQKLHKQVGYKTVLNLQPDLISPSRRPAGAIPYKLFGVVYHHGRTAAGGHYTCDILRQNAEWLHIDDTNITVISEADVTVDMNSSTDYSGSKQHMNGVSGKNIASESTAFAAALSASSVAASKASDGVAYVLFYIRSDQKDSPVPPMSIASSPATPKGSSMSKPITNGASQARSGATTPHAWSVPKK